MENNEKNILVPWDFSATSVFSLEHAVNIAKVMGQNILLVHIAHRSEDIAGLEEKLKLIAAEMSVKSGLSIGYLVKHGKVFKKIAELASQPETGLVVMKTDGIQGRQKYFGSNAIKIIRGSKIPFIVVQQAPQAAKFERIVYPVDYRTENKELVSYLMYMTKFYPAKLYLYKMFTKDQFHKKGIANNINFAKSMFEGKHLDYEIIKAEGKGDSAQELLAFAKSINADLIITQLQRNLTLTKFLLGVKEQTIIANQYKIPVVCLNPKELTVYGGFH